MFDKIHPWSHQILKFCFLKVKVTQSCLTLCDPMDNTFHGILQARILEWVALPFSGDFPTTGIKPRSPALQEGCLSADTQGKPKNTGVGSPSLLQWIFPTKELNQGLLHCRWILYQLSYQGSFITGKTDFKTRNIRRDKKNTLQNN